MGKKRKLICSNCQAPFKKTTETISMIMSASIPSSFVAAAPPSSSPSSSSSVLCKACSRSRIHGESVGGSLVPKTSTQSGGFATTHNRAQTLIRTNTKTNEKKTIVFNKPQKKDYSINLELEQTVLLELEKFEKSKEIQKILITSNTLSSSKIISKIKLKKVTHQFFPIDNNLITKKFI